MYKIIILNTIPANLDNPIQCPLLFTNSHNKVNILLDKLYIPLQFDQRIDLERFQFAHSFIMKFWNKVHEFNGNAGGNVENPNIVQVEFISGVCSDLYRVDLRYTKIKTTPSPATKNINDLKDYELKKAINTTRSTFSDTLLTKAFRTGESISKPKYAFINQNS